MNIELLRCKNDGRVFEMAGLKMMMFDNGAGESLRCRFICDWCKVDTYVTGKERLFMEIERNDPDVVLIDVNVYERIDGIETSRMIRSKFNVGEGGCNIFRSGS